MPKTIKHKADIHQEITDAVVESLEAIRDQYGKDHEGFAWDKPWIDTANGRPRNIDGKPYRGINVLLLLIQASKMGYTQNIWGTIKAWNAKGGKIIKGSKSQKVFFWTQGISKDKDDEKKSYWFLKTYNVFNACQIEGYEIKEDKTEKTQFEILKDCEDYVSNTNAKINHGGNGAFYSPSKDIISIPLKENFISTETSTAKENYYSTLLHELVHWTGSKNRLDRLKKTQFGSKEYAFEELVAETGSAILCSLLNVSSSPRVDHAKYLNYWIDLLEDKPRSIMTAFSQSSKAIDYLDKLQNKAEKVA